MCKSMNQAEMKALLMIVKKLSWNDKPALEVIETITQMVRNQQSLELDTVGECDDFEETLLSMATWDAERIFSTQFVSDYISLIMLGVEYFKEDMGLDSEALTALWNWEACKMNFLAPEYEAEDAFARLASEYNDADWSDFATMTRESWIRNYCY